MSERPAMDQMEATVNTTHTSAMEAAKRDALVVVAVVPLAALALASVDNMGYLANTPLALLLGLLTFAGICLPASTLALWPFNTPLRLHAHVGHMSAAASAVVY